MLEAGVAREIARGLLPLNIYTKFVWKMNLHKLMHSLHLRLHPHAQEEIRDYARAIERLIALYFPITHEAFVDYVRDRYTLSRMEVDVLEHIVWMFNRLNEGYDVVSLCRARGLSDRETKA